MDKKFNNKYRIKSTRWEHWDYRWNAAYFVTICTKNKEHSFGTILEGIMKLWEIGCVADECWHEIKNHTYHVELDAFVVMPNHIHGIVIIDSPGTPVETRHALSLPTPPKIPQPTPGQSRFQNQGKNSLSSIIGSYKSAVSKIVHRRGYQFAWQPRFYDRIIRDEKAMSNIRNYIINNPKNWESDSLHT